MIRSSSCRWQEKDQHIEEVGYHHFLKSWSDHDPDLIWLNKDLVIARSPVPINMIMLTFMMITWWWWCWCCWCCWCCQYDEEETPTPLPCECESGSEGYRWAEHNPSVLGFGRRMILRVFFFFPEHVTVDPLAWHLQLRMYNHVYPSDFLDILISWWDTEPTDFRVFMLFWSTHSTVPIASIFRPPLNFPNYDAWQKDSTISNGDQDRSIGWCHPRVASENSKQQLHEGESNGDIYPVVAWVLVFNPRRCSHQCTARPSSAVSPVGILEFGKTGLGLVELESTRMFLD